MKAKPILIAALVAATLPTVASANHLQGSDQQAVQASSQEETPFYRRVLRFPGRVVYSVVRTPLIIEETATGQRHVISRGGFFAADEDQRHSLTMRRVAFAGDTPDND